MTEEQLQSIKERVERVDPNRYDANNSFHSQLDVPALIAEVERLREALGLYADEKRWSEPCVYTDLVNGEPEEVKDAPWAILDGGDYARKALAGESK